MHLRATIIPCLAVLHLAVLAFPQVCGDAVCATNVASTTQARPTLSDEYVAQPRDASFDGDVKGTNLGIPVSILSIVEVLPVLSGNNPISHVQSPSRMYGSNGVVELTSGTSESRHYEKREESSSWVGRAWDTVMKFGQSIKQGIQKGILKLMQNQILKHPIALPPGVTPANLTFISKDGGVIWTGDHTDKKNMPPGAEWERITTKDWLSPRKRYAQATLPRDVEVTPEQVEESEDDADMLEYLDFDPYPGYDDY